MTDWSLVFATAYITGAVTMFIVLIDDEINRLRRFDPAGVFISTMMALIWPAALGGVIYNIAVTLLHRARR